MNGSRLVSRRLNDYRLRQRLLRGGNSRCPEAIADVSMVDMIHYYREINHRMRNHLQLVSSLLRLEGDAPGISSETKYSLMLTIERLHAVSLAHELLDQSDLSVDVPQYLRNLTIRLVRGHSNSDSFSCAVDADAIALPLDVILKIGLIVNELVIRTLTESQSVTNPTRRELTIICRLGDHHCRLMIADTESGLARLAYPRTTTIPLIEILANHLKGTITVEQGEFGSIWILKFPTETDYPAPSKSSRQSAPKG